MERSDSLLKELAQKADAALAPYAARTRDCTRETQGPASPLSFQNDAQSILNCKAYSRYMDKTQVIYLVQHDHVTRRGLHVQLVSHLSRSLGRLLNLNIDLIEAIALGHDVGHPPFGHEGEGYLSEISVTFGEGSFAHSAQSCRLLEIIEPLNLKLAVYDGFLCHDGGMQETFIKPTPPKSWQQYHEECLYKHAHPDCSITPMTVEGCLVKMCDTISYVVRDLEDALRFQLIKTDDIPEMPCGNHPKAILEYFSEDLLEQSYGHPWIRISQKADQYLRILRQLNYTHFYFHPLLKKESEKIQHSYRILCDFLLKDHLELNEKSVLFEQFLASKHVDYTQSVSPARAVIDFVAGMTDGFFLRTLNHCLIPGLIKFP